MSTLCGQHLDAKVVLVPYCIEELLFWRSNLASLKARDCIIDSKPSCFAYSDASALGVVRLSHLIRSTYATNYGIRLNAQRVPRGEN